MNVFVLSPDNENWNNYVISARRKWCLPGVKCSVCGHTWATTGVSYPVVDLSSLPNNEVYRSGVVSVEEFRELCVDVKQLVPTNTIIPPGTELGIIEGVASGKLGDFAWVNPWTLLIRHEALIALDSSGLILPNVSESLIRIDEKNLINLF